MRSDHHTVQFPLCLLAAFDNPRDRIFRAMAWGVITTGRHVMETHSPDKQALLLNGVPGPEFSKRVERTHSNDAQAIRLGRAYSNLLFSSGDFVLEASAIAESFLADWKAGGTNAPLVRIGSALIADVAWKGADYHFLSAVCAFNCAIGRKPYAPVTRNRIRAGMLGYHSGAMLFDDDGSLSAQGVAILEQRTDHVRKPITESQARTLLDRIHDKGLAERYQPKRGSLTYYSTKHKPDEIALMLRRRDERRAGTSTPLRGELPLCGEPSPHNEKSPHNGEVSTQSPPGHHPIATRSPHNAVSNAVSNVASNAVSNAGGARAFEKTEFGRTGPSLIAAMRAAVEGEQ